MCASEGVEVNGVKVKSNGEEVKDYFTAQLQNFKKLEYKLSSLLGIIFVKRASLFGNTSSVSTYNIK